MSELIISGLYTYPIKSCAGITSSIMTLDEVGPLYDRRWMVAVQENGHWFALTQREAPPLALVQPALQDDRLVLRAKHMGELRLPLAEQYGDIVEVTVLRDTISAVDVGREAAEWFSAFLRMPVKLVYMPKTTIRAVNPKYADPPAQTTLTDGYPILIISEASLAQLNDRLVSRDVEPIEMRRFRPNWVVKGAAPFAEDSWKRIRINGIECDVVKPCPRCVMTTVDPALGEVIEPREPLATLNTFRRSPEGKVMFGQNVIHRGVGAVHVGDTIHILA